MRDPAIAALNTSRIMTTTIPDSPLPGLRLSTDNPNHHLWNNHGTWFLHYTTHPTPFTKERIRRSLGTKSLETARERRDVFFAQLAREVAIRRGTCNTQSFGEATHCVVPLHNDAEEQAA